MANPIKPLLLSALLFSACSDIPRSRYTEAEITSVSIPSTGKVMNAVQIKATATGFNGCWKNINFEFTRQNDFEFTLKAYGFVTGDVCPDVKITKDTLISFLPENVGNYKINVNQKSNTIDVKEIAISKLK